MARYFIEVAYKGTAYSGFQVQENAVTIQSEIEKAFQILHRHPVTLTGSSRTDAGVHALQNYFHFDFEHVVNAQAVYKLNAILPRDIAVRNIYLMPPEAHCRFDALSRKYTYKIHTRKDPFLENTSLYYPFKLDSSLLSEGASLLKSQSNFYAFSKTNTQVNNYNCIIANANWSIQDNQLEFTITGNRFLRGMVRLVVGSLLRLGRGQVSLTSFASLFKGVERSGYSVPAHGLYLHRVRYPEGYLPVAGSFHKYLAEKRRNDLE